jgi:nicotinamidase-related amidase
MAADISALVSPATTALLLNEVQPPMVSGDSALGVAGAAILPNIVALAQAGDALREALSC